MSAARPGAERSAAGTRSRFDAYARTLVADWPPLSNAQRDLIAASLGQRPVDRAEAGR